MDFSTFLSAINVAFSTWLSMHFHLSHVTARQSNQGLAVEGGHSSGQGLLEG